MSQPLNHPHAAEINRIARLLLETWQRVDPASKVALHPVSYYATFADMARAVVEDAQYQHPDEYPEPCPKCGVNLISGMGGSGVKCPSCPYWFCY